MKNTINKIITVQQFLAEKFIQAQTDLSTISMTQSQLAGIASALNQILSIWDNNSNDNGGSSGGGSNNGSTQPEIPEANPNQKAIQVSGIQNGYFLFESILNGLYIPIFKDDTETLNKKYINAIKVNNETIGYSMLYYNVSYGAWRFDLAQYINGQYEPRDVFRIYTSQNWQGMYTGQPSGITQVYNDWVSGPENARTVTVQEIDWPTLDMLPNVPDTSMILFKVESCTNDATDLNGYYFACGDYFIMHYYDGVIVNPPLSYYCNLNLSLIACVMVTDMDTDIDSPKALFISKSSAKCFIGDTQDNNDQDRSENYKSITNITATKDNVGTPTVTILH